MEGSRPRPVHGRWLRVLLVAFLVRVAAQPLAGIGGWRWLPPFEAWHSGALPYPVLLATQLLLAVLMASAAAGVSSGRTQPRPALGRWVAAAAGLYATVMVPRLVLGLTVYRGHWWLDTPLPTVFHLVLMTFLAVYGHYHLRGHSLDTRGD
jgi:hypothetical protein